MLTPACQIYDFPILSIYSNEQFLHFEADQLQRGKSHIYIYIICIILYIVCVRLDISGYVTYIYIYISITLITI